MKINCIEKECRECNGTGIESWHIGCQDSEPPDCLVCGGSGRLCLDSNSNYYPGDCSKVGQVDPD